MSRIATAYVDAIAKKVEMDAMTRPHARYTLSSCFATRTNDEIMVQMPKRRIDRNTALVIESNLRK